MDRESKAFWVKLQELNSEDWTGQKLDLTTWEDEISFVSWTLKAIDGITFLLTSVLLVIIAIGIMNTLWIAIRERTREIGTLRAIGMQRPRVLAMFVIEAFCLGALGSLAGGAAGGAAFAGPQQPAPGRAGRPELLPDVQHAEVRLRDGPHPGRRGDHHGPAPR